MMIPNSNLSKKSRASDAVLETLSMAGGDGDGNDDDDFQNPSHAAALTQSLILSSHKSSMSQPLKPSIGGSRSRKRPRPSSATGKENRSLSNNRCSDFRISKVGVEKIAASTEMREFHDKIGQIDSDKRDAVVRCYEDDGIEVPKLDLSTSNVLCEDEEIEKGSHYFVPVESSLLRSNISASSFELSDSDVCTINDELGAKTGDCYDLEKSLAKGSTQSAGECKNCDGTENEEACLASTEFRLEEYWPRRNMEVQILNHSVEWGKEEERGNPCVNSSEVRLLGLNEKPFFSRNEVSGEDCCEKSDTSKQTKEEEVKENGAIDGELFLSPTTCKEDINPMDKRKENHYAMSIKAKLLDPRGKLVPSTMGGSCLEVGCSGEFEPGTQLNMLMDLCSKMDDEQYGSGSVMFSSEQINVGTQLPASEMNSLVVCPLCGSDITKLSEEMRQIHTNDCLDKDETTEISVPIDQTKPDACQQLVDTNPVLEWLRALDLCRYEEAFIREEIDWDTLQWLTEEDVISIGVVALGPRKKIVHALNVLRQRNSIAQDRENDASSSNVALNEKTKLALQGNKLITEYFPGHVAYKVRGSNPIKSSHMVERSSNHPTQKRVGNRRNANRGIVRDVPPWCCIPGTPFRVDAFRYLRGDCCHWFLTHFHMDHYQGLTKNFCHGKVYCSKITAHLVNMKIGVPWDIIQILHLNQTIMIAGVSVTCLDANHCPGAIIILFEPSNNKTILHTGDFRFSAEMAASSVLHSSHIHTLILDTTYCNPQYDFPKQEEVFQFVIDAIQAEAFNPKTLFLIGTYTIGKERLFLEVARTLRRKVYVGAGKLQLLRCLGLPEKDMEWFTANEMESHIHVVPMWTIASFKRMKYISNQYSDRYNLIVAFSPTGWTFGKGKKKAPGRRWQQGTIIRYEVPYSEHCSFTELKDFVRFISPENIIPSVNNEGPESADAMIALLLSDS